RRRISGRRTGSSRRDGVTRLARESRLACLDANVFLAVLIPGATPAPRAEIRGAERVLMALETGRLRPVSTAILLGEIRFVSLRESKPGFEIAAAAIQREPCLRIEPEGATPADRARERSCGHPRGGASVKVLLEEEHHLLQRRALPRDCHRRAGRQSHHD